MSFKPDWKECFPYSEIRRIVNISDIRDGKHCIYRTDFPNKNYNLASNQCNQCKDSTNVSLKGDNKLENIKLLETGKDQDLKNKKLEKVKETRLSLLRSY